MTEMHVINITPKRGPVDHEYAAGFKGRQIRLYAASLAQAKQRAIEHFRPKKRDVGLVYVTLVEIGTRQVLVECSTL